MKIFLLRHTESMGNERRIADSVIDTELSEKGIKDAKKLISALSKNNYDIFITSPLRRTLETLGPFLSTLNNPKVIKDPLTTERNLGEFTGSPIGTFAKYCQDNSLDRISFRPAKGESVADVYERAKEFLPNIKENYHDKSILICGHAIFLHCLELLLRDIPLSDFYSFETIGNGELKEFTC